MENNTFQILTWLNLKGPKLLQTGNERCPAAKHRRTQKHKLLPQQHRWHPKPPCFPHLLHSLHFHPAWVSHPTSRCYLRCTPATSTWSTQLHRADVSGSSPPHSAALRANASPKPLILSWEDHQYLSFTIWILIYCIGKYIIAKRTFVCVRVHVYRSIYTHAHTREYVYISI